ncbi:MAG: hypothetical protein PHW04_13315 [Candidatus Wallbacteria bacterium]|nr:hypothetical protein [Candidatus Wallbacteria bacterium]
MKKGNIFAGLLISLILFHCIAAGAIAQRISQGQPVQTAATPELRIVTLTPAATPAPAPTLEMPAASVQKSGKVRVNGWIQKTADAGFSPRASHLSLVFQDKIWVIGGGNPAVKGGGDVWNSADGTIWKEVISDCNTFGGYLLSGFIFQDKMWVISRNGYDHQLMVWNSNDGVKWTQIFNSADFYKNLAGCVLFKDRIWLIKSFEDKSKNSVFSSADGVKWKLEVPAASFNLRDSTALVVHNDCLWMIGGMAFADGISYLDDVWSSRNGIDWQLVTQHGGFGKRALHSALEYQGKIWITGGECEKTCLNDIWFSKDGANWGHPRKNAGFSPRFSQSSVVFKDRIWIIGGSDEDNHTFNDVWCSAPMGIRKFFGSFIVLIFVAISIGIMLNIKRSAGNQ